MLRLLLTLLAGYVSLVSAHAAPFHPSMWGFNVTADTFSYDNRPVVPLQGLTFQKWWFHNHLDYPPNDNTFLEVPAGKTMTTEIACDKGATSYYASSPGGDIQDGDNPCPGSPTTAFHANNEADTRGCAFAITHQSDVSAVDPADFTIFSVNHTCVWNRFTDFAVPANMPACPDGGCICAFFWIHAPDSGSEQIYMNGYRCKVTGAISTTAIATSRVPRRCGLDPDAVSSIRAPWNCTYGPKQPLYWNQAERNNMFEGTYAPPYYNDLYGFPNGAQVDIFQDSQLPVFNEAGEQTGVTTLGSSTVTTAKIALPTIASGWPTTISPVSGSVATAASGGSSGSSSSANASKTTPTPTSSTSSKRLSTSLPIPASVQTPSSSSSNTPGSSSSSTFSATPTSNPSSSSSSSSISIPPAVSNKTESPAAGSTTAKPKCRKRSVYKKKRALRAHKNSRLSKRHDLWA